MTFTPTYDIPAYDMRELVPSLAKEEGFSVAYLKVCEGRYLPVYVANDVRYDDPDIIEASNRGLLFAYADMKILNEFLPSIADMLELDYDIDTALKFCSEYSNLLDSAIKT